jgi:hypothetical protein
LDGLILCGDRLVIPDSLLEIVSSRCHDVPLAGHFGEFKTLELFSRNYWAPNYSRKLKDWIGSCDVCSRAKSRRHAPYGKLRPLPVPKGRWIDLSMDFIGPLPPSNGFNEILVVKDRLTKMCHFIPTVNSVSSKEMALLFLKEVVKLHGVPETIVSDRGPQFVSRFWNSLAEVLHFEPKLTTAYHPEGDGSTEVVNQVIEQYLRIFGNYLQDDWFDKLSLAEFTYNNTLNSTIGFTPFFANYGYHPRFDPDLAPPFQIPDVSTFVSELSSILAFTKQNLISAQKSYSKFADRSRSLQPSLEVGDLVFLNRKISKHYAPHRNWILSFWDLSLFLKRFRMLPFVWIYLIHLVGFTRFFISLFWNLRNILLFAQLLFLLILLNSMVNLNGLLRLFWIIVRLVLEKINGLSFLWIGWVLLLLIGLGRMNLISRIVLMYLRLILNLWIVLLFPYGAHSVRRVVEP